MILETISMSSFSYVLKYSIRFGCKSDRNVCNYLGISKLTKSYIKYIIL